MKITRLEVLPVQAPGRTLVPVLVHTDEGLTGLGVRFRRAAAHAPELTEPPHFHRPDGSFTNY